MEADIENPSKLNRFHMDGVHNTNIIEYNKKRKPKSDQLDLLRPKHKCWIGNSSSGHALMCDENPVLESMHIHVVKGITDATLLDDGSELESVKDSTSFNEDSNTYMSVNEEDKLEADSAKTYLYKPSTSSVDIDWDDYNVKDNHNYLDVSTVEKVSSSEEDMFVDNEYNPSYHYADLHTLKNLEEHFLGLESRTDHMCLEYAKDNIEEHVDKEFEDILYSKVENPNTYVLSSERWNVSQEAQSSTRPATIDQEFEQYFSMLML